ncbi:MAG TPA: hypothetical protein VI318_08550 [Baekduia sp.]
MSRAHRLLATAAALAACVVAAPVTAQADAGWHTEQPLTPAQPGGSGGLPVGLGEISDLSFWASNRGLLLTSAGLWAYDGTGWHQLSTVCGATDGRIAWAGPLDFWTISDQPVGQAQVGGTAHRSLCHFVNGQVVASYAQPIGFATSYEQMNAAACNGPSDCWFAGERLSGKVNVGAFHLHWDGTTLSAVPSLTARQPGLNDPGRAIGDLAFHQGGLYESVRVADDDVVAPGESAQRPYLLHQVIEDSSSPFTPLFPSTPIDYAGSPPSKVTALHLASTASGLYAIAGAVIDAAPSIVLRGGASGFDQVALSDPQGVFAPGVRINSVAADPDGDGVWIAYVPRSEAPFPDVLARVARLHVDGTVEPVAALPGPGDGIARKGTASKIACPAPGQCWLATSNGWLFHLGDSLPRDDEPAMHALITYRPLDDSIARDPEDDVPDDDSGIVPPVFSEPPPSNYPFVPTVAPAKKARKLVTRVGKPVVHGTKLELTITLSAKAHVQLVGKRGKKTVARSKRSTLAKGKHKLVMRLNRKKWPTKLDLRADPVNKPTTTSSSDDDLVASPDTATIASVSQPARGRGR